MTLISTREQYRAFRKWAKDQGYVIPRINSGDYDDIYVHMHGLTAQEMQEIFDGGFDAGVAQCLKKASEGCVLV